MLTYNKQTVEGKTVISLEGELDTLASRSLERELDSLLSDAVNLTVDMGKLEYITSAGLRILMRMGNAMEGKVSMKIISVSEEIMEIFEVTGFVEILTIE